MIHKYVRISGPIEAVLLKRTHDSYIEVMVFIGDKVDYEKATDGTFINIKTLLGTRQARPGHYIVKNSEGDISIFSEEFFTTYYKQIPCEDLNDKNIRIN